MIRQIFSEKFKQTALLVQSPGRINLIGEHTDYNNGFVLPAAIDKYVTVAIAERNDDLVSLYSVQFEEAFEVKLTDIKPVPGSWTNYVLGVVDQLQNRGYPIKGFNMAVDGNVPTGAGLSSSAAMECAVCFALSELFHLNIPRFDIAKISQMAEHSFPGVKCGIMDQFASVFGKKDHALKLDCRSLDYEEVPLILTGYRIVLLDTNVKHALASSAYNTRRNECAEGVEMIRKHIGTVSSLRDVTIAMLDEYVKDKTIYKRCRFVVEENERVIAAAAHLRNGNILGLGELMQRSHAGLRDDYEVSCAELDWLSDAVRNNPAVAGARMMGGGFGGCTINIVKEKAVELLIEDLSRNYQNEQGKPLTAYIAQTADGTAKI